MLQAIFLIVVGKVQFNGKSKREYVRVNIMPSLKRRSIRTPWTMINSTRRRSDIGQITVVSFSTPSQYNLFRMLWGSLRVTGWRTTNYLGVMTGYVFYHIPLLSWLHFAQNTELMEGPLRLLIEECDNFQVFFRWCHFLIWVQCTLVIGCANDVWYYDIWWLFTCTAKVFPRRVPKGHRDGFLCPFRYRAKQRWNGLCMSYNYTFFHQF